MQCWTEPAKWASWTTNKAEDQYLKFWGTHIILTNKMHSTFQQNLYTTKSLSNE